MRIGQLRQAAQVCTLLLGAAPARASAVEAGTPLEYDSTRDLVITGTTVGMSLLAETVLKAPLSPDMCRWCEPPAFDRSVRDTLVWNRTAAADLASWATLLVTPGVAYGGLGWTARPGEGGENAMIVTESVGVVWLATSLTKFAVGRERPRVHFRGEGWKDVPESDRNLSFLSGHTSLAFAFAVSGGTVASLRRYPGAPWIWGTGLVAATATGWLRIAADAHHATDVLAGAALGSLGGALVPLLLHPRRSERGLGVTVLVGPLPGGGSLDVAGTF